MSPAAELVAVLEVDPEHRVRCQASGCHHAVYRRIHVVRHQDALTVLGSACFRRIYAGSAIVRQAPRWTTGSGRRLTAEEALQLANNTRVLLQQLEAELLRLPAVQEPPRRTLPNVGAARRPLPPQVPSLALQEAKAEALRRVAERHPGLADQLHLPGWAGLVALELRDVLKERGFA